MIREHTGIIHRPYEDDQSVGRSRTEATRRSSRTTARGPIRSSAPNSE
jgi:hypothetical protein